MSKAALAVLAAALAVAFAGSARAAPASYNDPGGDNAAAAPTSAPSRSTRPLTGSSP